jgi:hypothetical protein
VIIYQNQFFEFFKNQQISEYILGLEGG